MCVFSHAFCYIVLNLHNHYHYRSCDYIKIKCIQHVHIKLTMTCVYMCIVIVSGVAWRTCGESILSPFWGTLQIEINISRPGGGRRTGGSARPVLRAFAFCIRCSLLRLRISPRTSKRNRGECSFRNHVFLSFVIESWVFFGVVPPSGTPKRAIRVPRRPRFDFSSIFHRF